MTKIFVSTDRKLLDTSWVCRTLIEEFKDRHSVAEMMKSFENSLCFGVYEPSGAMPYQLAFARVVTDETRFSSIMDVVVHSDHRRKGIGTKLIETILAHPDVKRTTCILSTLDKARFYMRFGFGPVGAMVMGRDPSK